MMIHLRKFNESNESELLIITDIFQEFADEYDVEMKITNMCSVNRFMVIIDTQKMEIKGDNKKVISHLIDLKNKCIEMLNLSMIEMSISFVRIPYYPPSPNKVLDYKRLEISDIKGLREILLPINWVRIIFEKRFENFNRIEEVQIIEDIFQEFVDEYDVKMNISSFSKSRFQPKNHRVTFDFNKSVDNKEGEMINLLMILKDRCLSMTDLKLFHIQVHFDVNTNSYRWKIVNYPCPRVNANQFTLGEIKNTNSPEIKDIIEISQMYPISRMVLCFQYHD